MSYIDIPKVAKDPHWFPEEFNVIIQIYQPAFSDFYQQIYMLVSKGQAQHWMNTANWHNPESSVELQMGHHLPALL